MHKARERYESGWEALKIGLALLAGGVPVLTWIVVVGELSIETAVLVYLGGLFLPVVPMVYGAVLVYLNRDIVALV